MRDRIFEDYGIQTGKFHTDYYYANGVFCKSDNYLSEWVNGNYSRMLDEGTKKTDEIRTRYLDHERSTIQSFPCDILAYVNSASCGNNSYYISVGRLGPGYFTRGNPWNLDSFATYQAIYDAFRFFESGCVDQETLLANFAWELPDVRRLWPLLVQFKEMFLTKRLKKSSLKEAKHAVKTVASGHLAYNFGIAPLIGDIVRIYDNLTGLNDHITWLRKNSGKPTKVEFKKSLPAPQTSTLPSRPTTPFSTGTGFWRKTVELRSGFKAWATITYDVSELSDLQLKIKSLVRAFGLNNPAAVIWEAMPYSFVVDWVTRVGDLFNRLEKPIRLPYVIQDCGYGVWIESDFEDWFSSNGQQALIRKTKTRHYSRRQGLPIGISGLPIDTPSAKQLVLGLALLAQKI